MRCGAILAAWLLAAATAVDAGATSPEALAGATARLSAAGDALTAAQEAQGAPDAMAAAIGRYEAALSEVRSVMIDAAAEERELRLAIAGRRTELMQLAARLQTLQRLPPPAPALHPMGPLAAVRAGAVLDQMTPALRAQADEAAETFTALAATRAVQGAAMSDIASGLGRRETARDALAAQQPPVTPAADMTALVRESDTLTALVAALAGPSTEAEPVPEGALGWPVSGRVLLGYNQPDGGRARRPGIVLGAPGLSLVTAPADGRVSYAGPFLDFGYVIVLRTAPGTLVTLAGLAELNVATGGQVTRGDLLGRLGGRNVTVEEYVMLPHAEAGAGALETLYIEIRHGRGPVDPVSWFGSGNEWEDDR